MSELPFLPPERGVDCACDHRLHRSVLLDHTGYTRRVSACLGCGAVTVADAGGDEPRAGDIRHYGNRVVAIPDPLRDWLARWPRRVHYGIRDDVYLPADLRCDDPDTLARIEEEACADQHGLTRNERLRRVGGVPTEAPPAPLSGEMAVYATVWRSLRDEAAG